jgi:hypothetical protein
MNAVEIRTGMINDTIFLSQNFENACEALSTTNESLETLSAALDTLSLNPTIQLHLYLHIRTRIKWLHQEREALTRKFRFHSQLDSSFPLPSPFCARGPHTAGMG